MDNNFTVIASLITAIAAIVAPIITSAIQSHKEYKLKKLELSYTQKVEAIKAFTSAFESVYNEINAIHASHFQKECLNLSVLCTNSDTRNSLLELSKMIMEDKKRTDRVRKQYNKCVKKLFEEM